MADTQALIAARLNHILKERDWTAAKFARAMGKSRSWAADVLNGKAGVTLSTLDQMLTVLKLDLVTFLAVAPSGDQKIQPPLPHAVTPPDLHSGLPSGTKEGADASPSLDPGVLEGRIAELERQLAAMRDVAITATTQNVAKRPERKTKPARKHSAGHRHGDRRLSR